VSAARRLLGAVAESQAKSGLPIDGHGRIIPAVEPKVYVVYNGPLPVRDYVREAHPNGEPRYWTKCQACALRLTRSEAHGMHVGKSAFKVLRLRPRRAK
jgi:hypothetical protein